MGSRVSLGPAAELEFVEITIIVVVVMVMVVVITCLLSHYKLSARSFIGRHGQGRRREDALSSVSVWRPASRCAHRNGREAVGGHGEHCWAGDGGGCSRYRPRPDGTGWWGRRPRSCRLSPDGREAALPFLLYPAGVWAGGSVSWGQQVTLERAFPAPLVLAVRPRTSPDC